MSVTSKKNLESLGLKWQEIATTEVNKQPRMGEKAKGAMGAVDTGRLRASLSYITNNKQSGFNGSRVPESQDKDVLTGRSGKDEVIVGSNINYALYVDQCTKKMAKRPYLTNSVANYLDDYKTVVTDVRNGRRI